jgi:acyl carrier protein
MNQVDEVKSEIRDRIRLALGVTLAGDEQHFFTEAGVDSLAFLNIVQWLESRYAVKFANATLPDLVTCNLLAAMVVELIAKKAAE